MKYNHYLSKKIQFEQSSRQIGLSGQYNEDLRDLALKGNSSKTIDQFLAITRLQKRMTIIK